VTQTETGHGAPPAKPALIERLAHLVDRITAPAFDFFDDLGATCVLGWQTLTWAVRPPIRLAQIFLALDFIGAGSTFIVVLVGLFTGMAFTVSIIVGFRQFSAEGMVGGVVALALARELAPVLAAVVVTARAGSTMASELGNMRVTYLVAVVWHGIDPGIFFDKITQFLTPADLRMLMVKSLVFGFIISIICCKKGFFAAGGARGVGEATAKAVVASIVAIFAFDYVLTTVLTDL
jgi:phospholipid/cholesterol/gamma-HCH transport system permease protein